VPAAFEGGQMPLHMRLPKLKGFTNRFRTEYQVVNLDRIAALFPQGGAIGVDELVAAGAVRGDSLVKVPRATARSASPSRSRRTGSPARPRRRSPPPAARTARCSPRTGLAPPGPGRGPAGTGDPRGGARRVAARPRPTAGRRARLLQSRAGALAPPSRTAPTVADRPSPRRARASELRPARARTGRTPGGARAHRLRSGLQDPDLRRKILFTLSSSASTGSGRSSPAPASPTSRSRRAWSRRGQRLYGLVNLFSGGALLQLSIFALGIMPYITASIILQLLVVVIPRLEELKKEGQAGQAKITQYTRYLTIALAVLQSPASSRWPGPVGCSPTPASWSSRTTRYSASWCWS
jgi:hypothetical protein